MFDLHAFDQVSKKDINRMVYDGINLEEYFNVKVKTPDQKEIDFYESIPEV